MIKLLVNGKNYDVEVDPEVPLLWVLRENLRLVGTKYGCGQGLCGSCTVLLNGDAVRSCQLEVGTVQGKPITTIEGVPEDHPVKKAWVEDQVPQCGYCQPGQIMQAIALLGEDAKPTEEKIAQAMDGVLCRCGTYPRIKKAIQRVIETGGKK